MVVVRRATVYGVIVAMTVLVWQLVSSAGAVRSFILPAPRSVLSALEQLAQDGGALARPILQTLEQTAIAFAGAAILAVPLGVAIGSSPLLLRTYEPFFSTLSAVPLVILYPVFAAALGIGPSSKIVLGLLYAFFPIVIITCRAAANVDRTLLTAARAMGATRVSVMVHATLPAISSSVTAALRVGLGLAFVTVVAGEFIAGSTGLGYRLAASSQELNSPQLFAWVVIAIAVTAVLNFLFAILTSVLQRGVSR